jgi:hypothetical protein
LREEKLAQNWERYADELDAACAAEYPYPQGRFRGRGIIIPAGGERYLSCAYVNVRGLRHFGCRLPIQIWHIGEKEMPERYRRVFENLGVTLVDAKSFLDRCPARVLNGWELKPYALINCEFEEVILLDADNTVLADPTFFFDTPQYRTTGAIFWPDWGRLHKKRLIWQMARIPYQDEAEFESGQIVLDKRRCWKPLHVAKHMNDHSDYYYRYIHGDKETYHMAWRKLGQPYAMAPGQNHIGKAMCQHDFQGRRIFQHRNTDKWTLSGSNVKLERFEQEDLFMSFLGELRHALGTVVFGYFDQAYLLNLDKDTDRMKRAERRLNRLSIPFERVSGEVSPAGQPNYVGGGLSQKKMLETILARGQKRAILFEDDVLLRDDVHAWMGKIVPQLDCLAWDVFYMGCHLHDSRGMVGKNLGLLGEAFHAHAYAVQAKAIPKMIACIERFFKNGGFFDNWPDPSLFKVYAKPILAVQEIGHSYTHGHTMDRLGQYFGPFDRGDFENNCPELRMMIYGKKARRYKHFGRTCVKTSRSSCI